jgi:hypothetical protein
MSPLRHLIHPGFKLRRVTPFEAVQSQRRDEIFAPPEAEIQIQKRLPNLPANVQIRILSHLLVFEQKINVLSRLDEDGQDYLEAIPRDRAGNPRFFNRFHIGGGETSVMCALSPQHVLSALGVSRLWNVWGCHLFYGLNTFTFSSFGE